MDVTGCRTESQNFILNDAGHLLHVNDCVQSSLADGLFVQSKGGMVTIENCNSNRGRVDAWYWIQLQLRNSMFVFSDFLTYNQLWVRSTYKAYLELSNVFYGPTGLDQIVNERWTPLVDGGTVQKSSADYTVI
jgi:hypothetical protein